MTLEFDSDHYPDHVSDNVDNMYSSRVIYHCDAYYHAFNLVVIYT